MSRLALIDSDILLYEIGYSSQKVENDIVEPASWDFAQDLLDKKIQLITEEAGAEKPLLFLTNTHKINRLKNKDRKREEKPPKEYVPNFREEVAKEKVYKGGRKADKPFHFHNLLVYMLAAYDTAIHEDGLEADDYLCIYQMEYAKKHGVRVPFHAGSFILDYEDYLKYKGITFIRESKGYVVNDTGKGPTRKVWFLHRDIMGNPEGMVVDHINGDKLDNRKCNLRICTVRENVINSGSKGGASQYKGVSWDKDRQKWLAQIKNHRESIFIGRFDLEEEAARAYDEKAKELHREFAWLNFPEKVIVPEFQDTIICSRDKDVRQVPFWHYSWELSNQPAIGPFFVEPLGFLELQQKEDAKGKKKPPKLFGAGEKFFYAQLVMGDNVDNIGGLKGRGPAFAYNLLKDATSVQECYELVAEKYVQAWPEDWKTKMTEQAMLLYMVRELDENGKPKLWRPPNE